MSSNSSGKRLEGFFTGKGFYIVLLLGRSSSPQPVLSPGGESDDKSGTALYVVPLLAFR